VSQPAAEGDRARHLNEARAGAAPPVEPTLPELLARAWWRAGVPGRLAGIAVAVALVALAIWLAFGRGGGSFSYDGPEAPSFSLSWGSEMERTDPSGEELFRLESEGFSSSGLGQYLAITPLPAGAIPPEAEDEPLPALALAAEETIRGVEGYGSGRLVLEGRTELAVDRGPEAYQMAFASPVHDGWIFLVKRILVPDPDRPGEGVEIEIGELTNEPRVIEKVDEAPAGFFLNWPIQLLLEDAASVRTEEGLEEPLRSFAFG
jgi:hypothetical protein